MVGKADKCPKVNSLTSNDDEAKEKNIQCQEMSRLCRTTYAIVEGNDV